jgi:sugar lactone lactonase YvrE
MKIARLPFFVIFFLSLLNQAAAQTTNYSLWLDHLPYNNCKAVTEAGDKIFAATPYSLIYFDKADNSLNRLNKVTPDGLSDIGISSIGYSSQLNTLVVAYTNTNIDLVKGMEVVNIPDIKRKQILGNKTINSILVIDKLAYLACGFGIVVVDIEKEEIKDTYYIGPSGSQIDVKALTFHEADNKFYAATEKGIYSALATSNLAYYVNWVQDMTITGPNNNFNLITSFGGKVYANKTRYSWDSDTMFVNDGNSWAYFVPNNHSNRTAMRVSGDRLVVCNYLNITTYKPDGTQETQYFSYNPGSIRPNDAMFDKDGKLWVADIVEGLWSIGSDLIGTNYIFNGPASYLVAAMDISGKNVWAVPGGRTASFTSLSRIAQCYTLAGNTWTSYNATNTPDMGQVRDILCVAADPLDADHAFMGSWGQGLLEFNDGELKEIYDTENSSLQYVDNFGEGYLRVGGLAFDSYNNLWVSNDAAPNYLSVRKSTGEWKSFDLSQIGTALDVGILVIDKDNQKWMQGRGLALYVFNDNNTIDNVADDKVEKLSSTPGNGNLPGSGISSLAVDRDGQLWIGTDQGVAVIYSPGNVFTGGNYDAQQVMVEEEGYLHPLLETENVTAIAVNGNNEKWLGTEKAGVFLMSADGTEELLHFTDANSPLLSNSIQSIKISSNGEVYFATSLGIVSYKDYKVEPPSTLDSLVIYPNPVRPEYKGPIYISNLVAESNVKITDVTGALVWETEAQGGQVVWDGNNLEARRVNTGVYLVFVTNPDGSQKKAGKVLFVR